MERNRSPNNVHYAEKPSNSYYPVNQLPSFEKIDHILSKAFEQVEENGLITHIMQHNCPGGNSFAKHILAIEAQVA